MFPTEMQCENVVCDVHLTDMRFVNVRHGMGIITKVRDGFAGCPVADCNRFFGTEGYCDLTEDSEFANIRTEPICPSEHEAKPMYIQRDGGSLRWVCAICKSTAPFQR